MLQSLSSRECVGVEGTDDHRQTGDRINPGPPVSTPSTSAAGCLLVHLGKVTVGTPAKATASTSAQSQTPPQRPCSRARGAGSGMRLPPLATLVQMQSATWAQRQQGCPAATAAGRAAWMLGQKGPACMGVGWGQKIPWMGA